VCVCLAEKAKNSRPDMVHTRPDAILSDKRSTEPSVSDARTCLSGHFTLEAEKHRGICRKKKNKINKNKIKNKKFLR